MNNTNPNWTIMVYIAADDLLSDFAVGSLRQLRQVASDDANAVVVTQFDANGTQDIRRLIFAGTESKTNFVQASGMETISPTDTAHPAALRDFINWAYAQRPADHYCLVLWGHGPELLAEDLRTLPDGENAKKFLTPADLRNALRDSRLAKDGHKFDIVMIDACNMSMVELACELHDYAEFLVASQEEVPDFSLPYDKILFFGRAKDRHEISRACREIPERYIAAYEDYLLTKASQTQSISLSSLALKNVGAMTKLLERLASAFLQADRSEAKRRLIMNARANSKDFVLGLYVDLYDFCKQLSSALFLKRIDEPLRLVCEEIRDAIESFHENALIVANKSSEDQRSHGISIYLPYLFIEADDTTNGALAKGETNFRSGMDLRERSGTGAFNQTRSQFQEPNVDRTLDVGGIGRLRDNGTSQDKDGRKAPVRGTMGVLNKGTAGVLNKGTRGVLNKMRRQRIAETELYYSDLEFSKKTCWDKFIRHGWSRWLVEEVEAKAKSSPETDLSDLLNQRYSAQQCALNMLSLCRALERGKETTSIEA